MRRLKLGVVGAGQARGQWWISTITKLSDQLELIGICEPVVERHDENRQRWNVPLFASLPEMIEGGKPEAVLCAAPPDANPVIAHVAARNGVHVVSEIPVAPTRRLVDGIVKVARDNNVKYEIAENVHRWPLERLKQQIVEAGLLGDLELVRLSYVTGSYHGFNAVRHLMGCSARRVMGLTRDLHFPFHDESMKRQLKSQRWGCGFIEFENGAVCWYEKPVMGGSGRTYWEVEGTKGNLTAECLELGKSESREKLPFRSEYATINGQEILKRLWIDSDPVIQFDNPFRQYGIGKAEDLDEVARAEILTKFRRAVIDDQPVAYPPLQAWPDQELVVAVEESQRRNNQWVSLPLDNNCQVEQEMHDAYRQLYGHEAEDVDSLIAAPMPRGGVRCEVLGDM